MKLASQMPVLDFLDAAFLAGQHDRGVDPLALQAEPVAGMASRRGAGPYLRRRRCIALTAPVSKPIRSAAASIVGRRMRIPFPKVGSMMLPKTPSASIKLARATASRQPSQRPPYRPSVDLEFPAINFRQHSRFQTPRRELSRRFRKKPSVVWLSSTTKWQRRR